MFQNQLVDAGNDAQICEDETYPIDSATATNYVSVQWSSSGDGTWTGANGLSPIYSPGDNDKSAGSVTLKIEELKISLVMQMQSTIQ